jgi:chromosome segregation ATPase
VSRVERIRFLQESLEDYREVIRRFEADRAHVLQRQKNADESDTARLAQDLAEIQRGLDLLEKALNSIKVQLEQELSGRGPEPGGEDQL